MAATLERFDRDPLWSHDRKTTLTWLLNEAKLVTIRLPITVMPKRADVAAEVFRAIADPTRRAILDRLATGARPVNQLAADFEQSRPAISKHLRVLRHAHLVSPQKHGREMHYRLEAMPLTEVTQWFENYRRFWQTSLGNLKRHLEKK